MFKVNAECEGETTYNNVIPITFDNAGTRRVKVEGVPAGSNCTTTVDYTDTYYQDDYEYEKVLENLDPDANPIPEVNFTLEYNDYLYKTKSLTNHFIYDNYGWIEGNGNVESSIIDSNGEIINDLKTEAPDIAIHEIVERNVKNITIENVGDKPAYVRVKVIMPSNVYHQYNGSGWFEGSDGYWYYFDSIQPGDSANELECWLELPKEGMDQLECNVVVIAESTIVLTNEDSTPKLNGSTYDGWDLRAKPE